MSKDKEKEEISAISDSKEESPVRKSIVKKYVYYVASSDGSGQIVNQVQLKDKNYIEWVKAVKKLEFIDGIVSIPENDPDKEKEW